MTPVNLAGVKPEQVPSRRHERPSATAQSSCQHGLFVKPPPAAGLCRRNEKPLTRRLLSGLLQKLKDGNKSCTTELPETGQV